MREGDWQIGWGCAATMYPTLIAPACARVRLTPEGAVIVQTATHEIGNGVYTDYRHDGLGPPRRADRKHRCHGRGQRPAARPRHRRVKFAASICNVVAKACEEIKKRIIDAAQNDDNSPLKDVEGSSIVFANGRVTGENDVSENLTQCDETRLGRRNRSLMSRTRLMRRSALACASFSRGEAN